MIQDGFSATYVSKADPAAGPAADAKLKPRKAPENPAQTVRGLVVDRHGEPLADAIIEQEGITYVDERGRTLSSFGSGTDWIDSMAVTNAKGEFEMAYGVPAIKMILNVSARGMAPKLFTETTGGDRKTMIVSAGSTIRGRLMQDGKPVAGAEVGLTTHERRSGTTFPEMTVGTREDGTFDLSNVHGRTRGWLAYGKMESLAARGIAGEVIECETKDDGQIVDVGDIQVKPAFALREELVLSDGKPVPPDTPITLGADRAWDSQMVVAGPDG